MNLNGKFILQKNKNKINNKKDLLSNDKIKLINLILSKNPISLLSNIKYKNTNLSHKIHFSGKRDSFKNSSIKKIKVSFDNNINNIKKVKAKDFSNYKIIKKENKKKIDTSYNNFKNVLKNKSFYIINKRSYEIPNDNISYIKKKKCAIKNHNSDLIRRLKLKKSKSISISRNLNISGCSFEKRKNSNKSLSNIINNFSINGKNSFYLKSKNKRNFSQDLKYKIRLFVKEQKLKNSRKVLRSSYSGKNLSNIKTSEKIITTNNSDKENTEFTTKKNNLTNHSNNIPYFTTNFNNSTNITETNNNEFIPENKISSKKKIIKKKLGLPFHPNSKKEEYYNQLERKNHYLIRNNKSEIYIPYNKANNKSCKIKRDISPFNNCRMKLGKSSINHSAKNLKNKNDYFFYLYSDTNNDNNNKNNNYMNSLDTSRKIDKNYAQKNNNFIILRNENMEKEQLIGVEQAHFRIVAMIQENKKLLNSQEN